jgi:hypothetical protein
MRRKLPWKSVMTEAIEVYYNDVFVGHGLAFWDGENLRTDIVSLTGEVLPSAYYNIRMVGEPVLSVYARTIQ